MEKFILLDNFNYQSLRLKKKKLIINLQARIFTFNLSTFTLSLYVRDNTLVNTYFSGFSGRMFHLKGKFITTVIDQYHLVMYSSDD